MRRYDIPTQLDVKESLFLWFTWVHVIYAGGSVFAGLSVVSVLGLEGLTMKIVFGAFVVFGLLGAFFQPADKHLLEWIVLGTKYFSNTRHFVWGLDERTEQRWSTRNTGLARATLSAKPRWGRRPSGEERA